MNTRIFHLRKQISNNLRREWTLNEMADYLELSAPHFQKLFKTEIGISPAAYVRELRLEKARELLETTVSAVKQIRYEVGINDDSHFTRNFKKRYGATPTEYRKLYWEKQQAEETDEQK